MVKKEQDRLHNSVFVKKEQCPVEKSYVKIEPGLSGEMGDNDKITIDTRSSALVKKEIDDQKFVKLEID